MLDEILSQFLLISLKNRMQLGKGKTTSNIPISPVKIDDQISKMNSPDIVQAQKQLEYTVLYNIHDFYYQIGMDVQN